MNRSVLDHPCNGTLGDSGHANIVEDGGNDQTEILCRDTSVTVEMRQVQIDQVVGWVDTQMFKPRRFDQDSHSLGGADKPGLALAVLVIKTTHIRVVIAIDRVLRLVDRPLSWVLGQ